MHPFIRNVLYLSLIQSLANSETPMSDQERIFPYHINTTSSRQVMTIRQISIRELKFDLISISLSYHHKNWVADSKENSYCDLGCERVNSNKLSIKVKLKMSLLKNIESILYLENIKTSFFYRSRAIFSLIYISDVPF